MPPAAAPPAFRIARNSRGGLPPTALLSPPERVPHPGARRPLSLRLRLPVEQAVFRGIAPGRDGPSGIEGRTRMVALLILRGGDVLLVVPLGRAPVLFALGGAARNPTRLQSRGGGLTGRAECLVRLLRGRLFSFTVVSRHRRLERGKQKK